MGRLLNLYLLICILLSVNGGCNGCTRQAFRHNQFSRSKSRIAVRSRMLRAQIVTDYRKLSYKYYLIRRLYKLFMALQNRTPYDKKDPPERISNVFSIFDFRDGAKARLQI